MTTSDKKCDYFHQFVKYAITDLKKNGICYVYLLDQVKEIQKKVKKDLLVEETDFGYSITYK